MGTNLNLERSKASSITLSNASEIVSKVIQQIAGNDISNTINGSKINNEVICSLTCNRIVSNLEKATTGSI